MRDWPGSRRAGTRSISASSLPTTTTSAPQGPGNPVTPAATFRVDARQILTDAATVIESEAGVDGEPAVDRDRVADKRRGGEKHAAGDRRIAIDRLKFQGIAVDVLHAARERLAQAMFAAFELGAEAQVVAGAEPIG